MIWQHHFFVCIRIFVGVFGGLNIFFVFCKIRTNLVFTVMSCADGIRLITFKKWQTELDPRNVWLKCVTNGNVVTSVYCDLCRKEVIKLRCLRNFNASFIDGVSNSIKKDNCVKHAKSEMHRHAVSIENKPKSVQEFFRSTPFGKSMTSVCEDVKHRINKLVDISYVLAREEIAFNKFPKFVELEKRHGVALGSSYNNAAMCEEFTECIAEVKENDLKNELKKGNYFSIYCDGSTDVSNTEQEIIFLTYINSSSNEIECKFLKITEMERNTAKAVLSAIKTVLDSFGISEFKYKLVGFLADGAAVNMGLRKGVAAELQKICPWLITVHCLSHRLELALKDYVHSTYLEEVILLLNDLHNFYSKSPSRLHQFRELASILNEHASIPTSRVQGVRWVAHTSRSVELLTKNYGVIIQQMETLVSEKASTPAKLIGMIKKLKSAKFVVWMLFFKSVLNCFAKLSLALQSDDVDMAYALHCVNRLLNMFEGMKEGKFENPLAELLHYDVDCPDSDEDPPSYQGIVLTNLSSISAFKSTYNEVLNELHDSVYNRFSDLYKSTLINSLLKIIQDKVWPTDLNLLTSYGVKELQYLCKHYKDLLDHHSIKEEDVLMDFLDFKTFWLSNLTHLSGDAMWKCFSKNYGNVYPNLQHIINILRLFPVSNAKVERAFSTMKRVKSDFRNRLSTTRLNHLLRISLEGEALSEFNPQSATELFFSKKNRRPENKPFDTQPSKKLKVSCSSKTQFTDPSSSSDSD